jgi:hypothetical protein
MSRWNRSVAWTARAVGVVLGGMVGVVAGGLICEAAGECGLEGFLFACWGLIIGIPVGGGSWSLQPARFGVALLVLVPLVAVSGARMAVRSS